MCSRWHYGICRHAAAFGCLLSLGHSDGASSGEGGKETKRKREGGRERQVGEGGREGGRGRVRGGRGRGKWETDWETGFFEFLYRV